ncbi:Uncharacterised protein [Bordetella ansorpii]|uniref:Uncharacterized protein n=1 Tax=Bordetella ansorpii TaxID=288768 RepID=A0A157S4V4_9BORD|nr:hypothetical protein [Bordetella ansorpii]SAI65293.1 Uncharacterised protein [Bordetella ansorpii]
MCLKPTTITTTHQSTSPVTDQMPVTQSPLSDVQPQEPVTPTLDVVQSPTQPSSMPLQAQVKQTITPLGEAPDKQTTGRAVSHKALTDWKNDLKKQPALKPEVEQIWNALTRADYVAKKGSGGDATYAFRFGAAQAVHDFRTRNPDLNLSDTAVKHVLAFIEKHMVLHSNIDEAYGRMTGGNPKAFRDWFHSFAGTVSLLGARSSDTVTPKLSAPKQRQLIKAELMRGQLQATYTPGDADRLGRSLSPLVREGYGRGVKTGLWMAAAAVRTEQVKAALGPLGSQLNKFEVYPVNHAFTYNGTAPVTVADVPGTLAGVRSVYIESLGVQVVHKDIVDKDIHGFLGGRGLRSSASECAELCAQRMVEKIGTGDVSGALKTLDKAFDGVNAKAVKEVLGQVELMPNTLIAPDGVDALSQSSPQQLRELKDAYAACVKSDTRDLPLYLRQNIQVVRNLIGDIDRFGAPGMPATVCAALTDALQRASELLSQARFMAMDLSGKAGVLEQDRSVIMQRATQLNERLFGDAPQDMEGHLQRGHVRAMESDIATHDKHFQTLDVLPQATSLHMEHFYQAMQDIHHVVRFQNDWAGRAPALDGVIGDLLLKRPEPTALTGGDAGVLRGALKVESAPHALALLEQIQSSLSTEELSSAAILTGAYYETPALFPGAADIDSVDSPALREKRLIVMEPHPNNAAKVEVHPHDPVALIQNVFGVQREHPCTLVIDCTLNHLGEEQIARVLHEARPHIESGVLNLVLVQSGTKFFQNGMDIVNIGTAAIFNKGDNWTGFQDGMDQGRMHVPDDDKGYIASMLSGGNEQTSMEYLSRVRHNTSQLRGELLRDIPPGHTGGNAFELCANTDDRTVYVAFRPTDAYVARVQKKPLDQLTEKDRADVNVKLYTDRLLPGFNELATVDRSSFGFNVTNFGECHTTVRITLGIEEPGLLQEYARKLVALGERIHAEG